MSRGDAAARLGETPENRTCRSLMYDAAGELSNHNEYQYDEMGQKTEQCRYDVEDNLVNRFVYFMMRMAATSDTTDMTKIASGGTAKENSGEHGNCSPL